MSSGRRILKANLTEWTSSVKKLVCVCVDIESQIPWRALHSNLTTSSRKKR